MSVRAFREVSVILYLTFKLDYGPQLAPGVNIVRTPTLRAFGVSTGAVSSAISSLAEITRQVLLLTKPSNIVHARVVSASFYAL